MIASWLAFGAAACAISWLGLAALRPILTKYQSAIPNTRSSHATPTPQGGGIAVVLTTLVVAAAALVWLGLYQHPPRHVAAVCIAALALLAVGTLDDMRHVGIVWRLAAQVIAVTLVVATLPSESRLWTVVPFSVERAIIVLAGVWYLNLFNFMDGIDLMAAGETLAIAVGVLVLAVASQNANDVAMVAAILTGAALGFVPWNKPVAKIFLGNGGSLAIALLTGALLLHVAMDHGAAVALILPLYFLCDATITVARRLLKGARIWEAHREHFYQRALGQGFGVGGIVATVTGLNILLIALALAGSVYPAYAIGALAVAAMATGFVLWLLAGRPSQRRRY